MSALYLPDAFLAYRMHSHDTVRIGSLLLGHNAMEVCELKDHKLPLHSFTYM